MISRANAAGASCEHHVGAGRTTRRCATAQMFQLLPWQSPPCARLTRRESAELLKRLHDSGLSIFEPDPIAEFERVRPRSTKILRREETCVWIGPHSASTVCNRVRYSRSLNLAQSARMIFNEVEVAIIQFWFVVTVSETITYRATDALS